jgi:biotin transport system substrate-specific component
MSHSSSRTIAQWDARSILRILFCTALTSAGAHWALKLPYTPVPMTWQVAAVLFSGLWLGARGGFASQALYLTLGLAGAPIFAFGNGGAAYLFNPMGTGGYLLSYPLAAWLTGYVMERGGERRSAPFLACLSGLAAVYGMGCLWLGAWLRLSVWQTLLMGAGWFLFWDAVKAMLAILAVGKLSSGRRRL